MRSILNVVLVAALVVSGSAKADPDCRTPHIPVPPECCGLFPHLCRQMDPGEDDISAPGWTQPGQKPGDNTFTGLEVEGYVSPHFDWEPILPLIEE